MRIEVQLRMARGGKEPVRVDEAFEESRNSLDTQVPLKLAESLAFISY